MVGPTATTTDQAQLIRDNHSPVVKEFQTCLFECPMATAATIDRIVHHSVILEFDLPGYRTSDAQGRELLERKLHLTPSGQNNCH